MKKFTLNALKKTMKECEYTIKDFEQEDYGRGKKLEYLITELNCNEYISYDAREVSIQDDAWLELSVYIKLDENNRGAYTFNYAFCDWYETYEDLFESIQYQEKRAQEIIKITTKK